jgi:hypothetical protein
LNLYFIQTRCDSGYETYDSAVVVAESAKQARKIHPDGGSLDITKDGARHSWVGNPDLVIATFIGKAKRGTKVGVICASFNAG